MNYAANPDFEEIPAPNFFMTLLDETGDTAITWQEADDVDVLTFIQSKLDSGYIFFIERPRAVRFFTKKKRIRDIDEIKERRLFVADEKAADLHLKGKIALVKMSRDNDTPEQVRKSTDKAEIAASTSYAVKPVRGG